MCKINSSLNKSASNMTRRPAGQTYWIPNTDVFVMDEALVVRVELAGMRQEDLEIAVEGNLLLIKGQRPDGCRGAGCRFLVMEINYGPFECVLEIPPEYDLKESRAAYTNGFLQIDIPKLAPAPTKKIKVQTSDLK